VPYHELSIDVQVITKLIQKKLLTLPEDVDPILSITMQDCWQWDPELRITAYDALQNVSRLIATAHRDFVIQDCTSFGQVTLLHDNDVIRVFNHSNENKGPMFQVDTFIAPPATRTPLDTLGNEAAGPSALQLGMMSSRGGKRAIALEEEDVRFYPPHVRKIQI
jgi:hypothetical protein